MKLDLLVLAIAPVIAIILWIYLKDKYDKEPICILIKFFIFGILVSMLAIYGEEILIKVNIFSGKFYIFYMSFIVAGLVEEGLKALVLIPDLLKEKTKTGDTPSKDELKEIIQENEYNDGALGEDSFVTKDGGYTINYDEIIGWE